MFRAGVVKSTLIALTCVTPAANGIVSPANAQACNYDLQRTQLISSLTNRASAEADDRDFEAACDTMRQILALYNQQIEEMQFCGDLISAVQTQTTARSAARLGRLYCNENKAR